MRKTFTTIVIIVAIVLICFLAAGYAAIRLTKKPQSTPLSLVTSTASRPVSPTKTLLEPSKSVATATAVIPTQTALADITEPSPVETDCRLTGQRIVLILGRSIHLPPSNHKADLIRLIKVDFEEEGFIVYAFPGELIVETSNLIEKYRIQNARLGDIYSIIVNQDGMSADSEYRATQAVAQVILNNFGVAADHYLTIKEDIVINIVDTLGGVELDLPQEFIMPSYSDYKGMKLQPGKYVFNGDMVHAYMTYLLNTSDEWQRISRQNVLLDGMRRKMLEPANFLKIPELFQLYKENIVTDLSLDEIAAFSCLVNRISSEKITFFNLPQENVTVSSDGSMRLSETPKIINQLQMLFGVP